jgi:hypothetical protein
MNDHLPFYFYSVPKCLFNIHTKLYLSLFLCSLHSFWFFESHYTHSSPEEVPFVGMGERAWLCPAPNHNQKTPGQPLAQHTQNLTTITTTTTTVRVESRNNSDTQNNTIKPKNNHFSSFYR